MLKTIVQKKKWQWIGILLIFIAILQNKKIQSLRYFRIDLTQEKRNSLHPITKKILKKVQAPISIKIYLAGNLPAGPKKLQQAVKALLTSFQQVNTKIQYQWINLDDLNIENRQKTIQILQTQGIQPSYLSSTHKGKRVEKTIFPGAVLTYKNQSLGVLLLQSSKMMSSQKMLHQSIENLEYHFALSIQNLIQQKKKIALLQSHSLVNKQQLIGLWHTLAPYYQVEYLDTFPENVDCLQKNYEAIIVIKPQRPFTSKEKYSIDQYLMQGGKLLWFIDRVNIDMKKFFRGEKFAIPIDIGLDDLFFQYGLRINYDLIQDAHAGVYPIVVGNIGNQPKIQLLPFPFFPVLNHFATHPITQKLQPVYTQFVSSIDTIKTEDIRKTPLLYTSPHTEKLGLPMHIDLEILRQGRPDIHLYQQGKQPVAYLLEGYFTSLYMYQPIPTAWHGTKHINRSLENCMLVVSSGNMLLNAVHPQSKKPILPLGHDPFLKKTFAQGDFILNALAYMLKELPVIQVKNKKIHLRMLDPIQVEQQKFFWQMTNLFFPVLLLIILGIVWYSVYIRRYQ